MNELWHVSEDPTIEVFHPHHNELHALDEPLVWAVDSQHIWLYWFPRDCPRACFNAKDDTTDEDVARWLDGDRDRRVAVIETGWLERMRSTTVYAYAMLAETFEPWDKFFVSRETVVPARSWSSATCSRATPWPETNFASRRRSIPSGTR